jgi:hypothetical protein
MLAVRPEGADQLIFRLIDFRCWQILLQKSQKAQRLIFRQRTKQATIADQ